MNLFDLVATLSLDTSSYEKGLDASSEKATGFGSKFGTVMKGTMGVVAGVTAGVTAMSGAFVKSAKDVTAYGDNIDKMSQKLGLSAEAYQKWDYVMQISGTDIDGMAMGIKTLTNKLDSARNGGKKAQEAFKALGLSMEDLEGASREEVFEKTIKAFQGMEDNAERASLANKMFGRSGQELIPLFNTTAEATDELMQKAQDYGMVMSDDAVKASAEFNDSLTTLGQTATGLKNRLMGEFLPSLTIVTDGLSKVFTGDMSGADAIVEGIKSVIQEITGKLPEIMELGGKIVGGLTEAIMQSAPMIFEQGATIITGFVQSLSEGLPDMLTTGVDILTSIIDGITEALPSLIEAIPVILTTLVVGIAENLPTIIESGVGLIGALVEGLIKAIPTLIANLPTIVMAIVNGIVNGGASLLQTGIDLIGKLIEGIISTAGELGRKVWEFAKTIPDKIGEAISNIADIGLNIVEGIWNGISGGIGWIKQKISGWVGNVMDFLKGLFGIASPSKWARDVIGYNIAKGMALGITDGEGLVQNAFDDMMPDYDLGEYSAPIGEGAMTARGVNIVNYITVDGADDPEDFANRFVRQLRMDMRTV